MTGQVDGSRNSLVGGGGMLRTFRSVAVAGSRLLPLPTGRVSDLGDSGARCRLLLDLAG